ncbi:MAG: methenyltetrahydrofolate cyclohydrolase [Nitrospirae bacterium]|nr:MAG: methenyltetrahydrofolate cyclohydrolase [Nitrospirota bacterium]
MVANLTVGKKKYAEVEEEMRGVATAAECLRERLLLLMDRDTEAFDRVMACYRMPQEDEAQKEARQRALQEALEQAAEAALEICRAAHEAMPLAQAVAERGNAMLVSDAGCAAAFAEAALAAALLTVKINCNALADRKRAEELWAEGQWLEREVMVARDATLQIVYGRLG